MPHPDWEDISAFFELEEFATTANITRGSEKVADVLGIFDDPSQMATLPSSKGFWLSFQASSNSTVLVRGSFAVKTRCRRFCAATQP